jgi:hypothetical protein
MEKSARNRPEIHNFVVRSDGEANVRAPYLLPLELA